MNIFRKYIENNEPLDLLKGISLGAGFILVSIFILTSLIYFFDLSMSFEKVSIYICLIVGMFICGMYCGNKALEKGFLTGVVSSIIIILLLILLNIIINFSGFNFINVLLKSPILIFSSFIGGIIGANLK